MYRLYKQIISQVISPGMSSSMANFDIIKYLVTFFFPQIAWPTMSMLYSSRKSGEFVFMLTQATRRHEQGFRGFPSLSSVCVVKFESWVKLISGSSSLSYITTHVRLLG